MYSLISSVRIICFFTISEPLLSPGVGRRREPINVEKIDYLINILDVYGWTLKKKNNENNYNSNLNIKLIFVYTIVYGTGGFRSAFEFFFFHRRELNRTCSEH